MIKLGVCRKQPPTVGWGVGGVQTVVPFTWTGRGLHVVVLLVPLHGAVVTQHHLPQCFAEVRQAGDVAVQGDVLPTEKGGE